MQHLATCNSHVKICDIQYVMQGMPALEGHSCPLRRHGDEVERLPGGFYIAHGRCDDTMNLGGIKVCVSCVTRPMHCVVHLRTWDACSGFCVFT